MKSTTLCAGIALASFAPTLHAGGIEHYCNGTQEIVEAWPAATAGALQLTVNNGPAGTKIAPGFPGHACSWFLDPDELTHVGIQSIGRAMQAWNDAAVASTDTSDFAFALPLNYDGFNLWQIDLSVLWPITGFDGDNTVTLWETSSSFSLLGGPLALAITPVAIDFSTGEILEADVAINVRSEPVLFSGVGYWSFVEENDLFGLTFGTHPDAGIYAAPVLGYADLQGVLTHELGHVAGLGHSMIDSVADDTVSRFPCMFPYAQGETFSETLWQSDSSCTPSNWTPHTVTGAGLPTEGILGRSARVVRRDDASAIGQAYPSATFGTALGRIVGTVLDSGGQPVLGANVVAFAKDRPDNVRVATLTYGGGAYSIEGLQAGAYLLYVEPIDQNPNFGQPTNGHYFGSFDVPNYAYLSTSGCITAPVSHPFEFWDTGDSAFEANPLTATTVQVAAGVSYTRNFVVNQDLDLLTVRDQALTSNFRSPRGMIVIGNSGTYPVCEIRISDPLRPNQPFELYFGPTRSGRIVLGQVVHVIASTASGLPGTVTGTLDANGEFTYAFQPTTAQRFLNVFVQARVGTVAGGLEYSNPLNVWVTN